MNITTLAVYIGNVADGITEMTLYIWKSRNDLDLIIENILAVCVMIGNELEPYVE